MRELDNLETIYLTFYILCKTDIKRSQFSQSWLFKRKGLAAYSRKSVLEDKQPYSKPGPTSPGWPGDLDFSLCLPHCGVGMLFIELFYELGLLYLWILSRPVDMVFLIPWSHYSRFQAHIYSCTTHKSFFPSSIYIYIYIFNDSHFISNYL